LEQIVGTQKTSRKINHIDQLERVSTIQRESTRNNGDLKIRDDMTVYLAKRKRKWATGEIRKSGKLFKMKVKKPKRTQKLLLIAQKKLSGRGEFWTHRTK